MLPFTPRLRFALACALASTVGVACSDDGASSTSTSSSSGGSGTGASGSGGASMGGSGIGGQTPDPTCTDGLKNGAETGTDCGGPTCDACGTGSGCDTGADCESGVCDPTTNTCAAATCGDGVVNQSTEACDDGNADDTDACVTGCALAECGDGFVQAGVEPCDDGNMDDTDACLTTCVSATCGDGVVDAGVEDCDDANVADTDACLSNCLLASCGDGFVQAGVEVCDDANGDNTDACLDTCAAASCGDGFVQAGVEGCDDGMLNSDSAPDACRTTCALPGCGDAVTDTGEACDDGNVMDDLTCAGDCSTVCGPLAGVCNGSTSTYCAANGGSILTELCDPLQGKACDVATGLCTGSCADRNLGVDHLGCDFDAADMRQFDASAAARLVLTNAGAASATVTLTRGAATVATVSVPAGSTVEQTFPATAALRSGTTVVAADSAIRVRSTEPIAAYILNVPGAASADTSLLTPVRHWGTDHYVASYTPLAGYPSTYTVIAREDNTTVTLTPSAVGGTVVAGGGVAADGSGTVNLNADDVLQVMATGTVDLTGTRVVSNHPVQVAGGVICAQVPSGTIFCDHLEDTAPPVSKLGTTYFVAPAPATTGDRPSVVRVVATQAGTTLTYEPPQAGAPSAIALAGGFVELAPTSAAFRITASAKVVVAQYYPGQNFAGNGSGTGDPAMKIVTPVGRFLDDVTFGTSSGYTPFISVVVPSSATATLDGATIAGRTAVGASGFDRVNIAVPAGAQHRVVCSAGCAIDLLGLSSVDSYWHPAGAAFNDL